MKFLGLIENCKLNYIEQILFLGLWSFYYLDIATVRQEILLKEHIDSIADELALHVQKRRRDGGNPEGDYSELLIQTKPLANEFVYTDPEGQKGKKQVLEQKLSAIKTDKMHQAIIEEIKYQLKMAKYEISQYYEGDYTELANPVEISVLSNLTDKYNELPIEKGYLQFNMGIELLNLFTQLDIKLQHKVIAELVRKLEALTTQ